MDQRTDTQRPPKIYQGEKTQDMKVHQEFDHYDPLQNQTRY